ncbi:NADPH-adrenodoxin reductase [Yamadazyma tenuis]|nr:NADPH-adrenodoxin reductase [Yamadazyma tenuis]
MVGSGPAGFYTAYHLLKKSPTEKFNIKVDFFERLPAPYGLSRYGVAPDHPEVKNCEEYMNDIMEMKDRVRFFGNVNIGEDISIKYLQQNYHSVVLSYGCVNADAKLDIPGSHLPGVVSARQFVNWYNGHPDFYSHTSFEPPPLHKIQNVTIIGNGNVALDVARVLLADPESHWAPTDIAADAVEVLKTSSVKTVNIIARRGLLESAFTNKELRELLELSNTGKVRFVPVSDDMYDALAGFVKKLDRVNKRRVSILDKYSKLEVSDIEAEKSWSLQYLKTPVAFVASEDDPQLLCKTIFSRNEIVPDNDGYKIVASTNTDTVELENDLVILSIGYKGSALNEFDANEMTFDDRQNRILNGGGRVISSQTSDPKSPVYKAGFYTSGWIKNGPKGVIASTMMDSFDTAENMIQDLANGVHTNPTSYEVDDKLASLNYVSWSGWQKLNDFELKDGEKKGKTRNKVCIPESMLAIACK